MMPKLLCLLHLLIPLLCFSACAGSLSRQEMSETFTSEALLQKGIWVAAVVDDVTPTRSEDELEGFAKDLARGLGEARKEYKVYKASELAYELGDERFAEVKRLYRSREKFSPELLNEISRAKRPIKYLAFARIQKNKEMREKETLPEQTTKDKDRALRRNVEEMTSLRNMRAEIEIFDTLTGLHVFRGEADATLKEAITYGDNPSHTLLGILGAITEMDGREFPEYPSERNTLTQVFAKFGEALPRPK